MESFCSEVYSQRRAVLRGGRSVGEWSLLEEGRRRAGPVGGGRRRCPCPERAGPLRAGRGGRGCRTPHAGGWGLGLLFRAHHVGVQVVFEPVAIAVQAALVATTGIRPPDRRGGCGLADSHRGDIRRRSRRVGRRADGLPQCYGGRAEPKASRTGRLVEERAASAAGARG